MTTRRFLSQARARLAASAALVLAVATLGVGTAGHARAAQPFAGTYVALGDSYSSGPGIPTQRSDSGTCFRSDHNYPTLVAQALQATQFKDVSCGGALVPDLTGRQFGLIAPQVDALTPDTTLVTLSIGGNDAGFGEVVVTCAALYATDPNGSPCKDHFTAGGVDQLQQRLDAVAPQVGAALADLHRRVPQAAILLVGYPDILPESKAQCVTDQPIAAGDFSYLRAVNQRFSQVMPSVAAANGATFVDTFASSVGHDACQAPGTRFLEGLNDVRDAAPVHPNALGMQDMARQVLTALGR